MSEKNILSRIQHKHDIEANWIKAVNFIPKKAELIVYDPDENFDYSRAKIGDGIKNVNDLPFMIDKTEVALKTDILPSDWNQNDPTAADFIKNKPNEEDAFKLAIETELISPVATASGEILTDNNGIIITM